VVYVAVWRGAAFLSCSCPMLVPGPGWFRLARGRVTFTCCTG